MMELRELKLEDVAAYLRCDPERLRKLLIRLAITPSAIKYGPDYKEVARQGHHSRGTGGEPATGSTGRHDPPDVCRTNPPSGRHRGRGAEASRDHYRVRYQAGRNPGSRR